MDFRLDGTPQIVGTDLDKESGQNDREPVAEIFDMDDEKVGQNISQDGKDFFVRIVEHARENVSDAL